MMLIADCGGTSCDWKIFQTSGEWVCSFSTAGLNLTLASEEQMKTLFTELPLKNDNLKRITHLFFFGAGTEDSRAVERAKVIAHQFLPHANSVFLSDLELVARVLSGKTESVCCILGTGANVAWWTGFKLVNYSPALGYILGDECSGAWFGKRLIRDFYYNRLPEELAAELKNYLPSYLAGSLQKIYRLSAANAFIAGAFGSLKNQLDHPYMIELIREGIMELFYYHIHHIPSCKCAPICFGGSVAAAIEKHLREYCAESGYLPPIIEAKPMDVIDGELVRKLFEDFSS